jgi:triphosphoribosyl-dephospho-CoA synthase
MLSTAPVSSPTQDAPASARGIARAALLSLHTELTLSPKPGLVCPGDNGSHSDMNATMLWRSAFALRHYFKAIALAGYRQVSFGELQKLGIAAELRMLRATGGVNTHRGAVFNLGLLAAAAAHLVGEGRPVTAATLGDTVRTRWSSAICAMRPSAPSHGLLMASRHGAGGARAEAALGYPSVLELGLPVLRQALRAGLGQRRALLQTLFELIARLTDTNLLYRGGGRGLHFAQDTARDFLAAGGAADTAWETRAQAIRDAFVARCLSPGGAADLLAATWFAHLVTCP